MKESLISVPNRRDFISKIVPACGLLCSVTPSLAFADLGDDEFLQQEPHKFDSKFDRPITQRQMMRVRYGELINTVKAMKKEFGDERTIEFLKKTTHDRMLAVGKRQAEREGKNDFRTYSKTFTNPNAYKTSLTKETIEDTDTVLELKVTECIWAATFLDADAGDIGFAVVCYGDYAWPQGFNPKIKMIRDKTLMQGHDCCNHRYVWTD